MVPEKFAFMTTNQFQPPLMDFGHLSSEARVTSLLSSIIVSESVSESVSVSVS